MRYLILCLSLTISCARNVVNETPLPTATSFVNQLKQSTFYYVIGDGYWSNDVDRGIECLIKMRNWTFDDGEVGKLVVIWVTDGNILDHVDKFTVSNGYDDTLLKTGIPHTWVQTKIFALRRNNDMEAFETIEGTMYPGDKEGKILAQFFKENDIVHVPTKFNFK